MSTERISFNEIYMRFAEIIALRSTCSRLQVGSVITSIDYRKVLSIGYNGNATGLNNGCDSEEPGKCGCLHSEENAIINCDSPREQQKIFFVTHVPCVMCAKRIINLGNVVEVNYRYDYRDLSSIEILENVGIGVNKI